MFVSMCGWCQWPPTPGQSPMESAWHPMRTTCMCCQRTTPARGRAWHILVRDLAVRNPWDVTGCVVMVRDLGACVARFRV
jgi:hypothetical protein